MKSMWIVAVCAALLTPLGFAQDAPQPTKPKLTDAAKVAFGELKAMHAALKGKRGPERLIELQQIAERSESIAREFAASDPLAATRAWYEAGESWRRHGSLDKAAAGYAKALEVGGEASTYRDRALFGLAQMQRRSKQFDAAIESYRKCSEIKPDSNRAHDSRVWIARCLDASDRADAALDAFRAAYDSAKTARQRIGAGNWLAKALVARGQLDAARSAIQAVEQSVRAEVDAGGKAGERLAKALEKMSARKALQRALDKQGGAVRDAVDVEASR